MIIILDKSGSMSNFNRMKKAIKAAKILIHGLTSND